MHLHLPPPSPRHHPTLIDGEVLLLMTSDTTVEANSAIVVDEACSATFLSPSTSELPGIKGEEEWVNWVRFDPNLILNIQLEWV